MSERKVLNKYFPPDFDPALIPRRKISNDKQIKVRLITPFSMRCDTCGEYIYKGKKFNAKKELTNEEYLGIKIFRFYIRCNKCSAEITFKTDPKNNDYKAEHGAQMKFEVWNRSTTESKVDENIDNKKEDNPIKTLEERTRDSKRELDIVKAIDEIKNLNDRNEFLDNNEVLEDIIKTNQDQIAQKEKKNEEEDALITKETFSRLKQKEEEDEINEMARIGSSLFGAKSEESGISHIDKIASRKRKNETAAKLFGITLKKKK